MRTENNRLLTVLVVSFLIIANAGITLYLPSLPTITHAFNVTSASVKWTLSLYMLGYTLSQLVYGPLSDAVGRRVILIIGLSIFVLGTILSTFAINLALLDIGRLIEGLGVGAANAVGYALMRDVYSGDKLTKQLANLSVFVGMTPIVAPLIGGYLVQYIGWRSNFAFLGLVAIGLLTFKWLKLPETNLHLDVNNLKVGYVASRFWQLLTNPLYLGFMLSAAFSYAAVIAIYSMLPFIFITHLHISPSVYGWLPVLTGLGYITGSFSGGRIAARIGIAKTIAVGALLMAVVGVLGAVIGYFVLNIWVVILPLMIVLYAIGLVLPIGLTGAIAPFPKLAGSASALAGAGLAAIASLVTTFSAHLGEETQRPMMYLIVVIALIIGLCVWVAQRSAAAGSQHQAEQ